MTPEQAIKTIDDHFVWLAKRKMINNTMLRKLSGALVVITENINSEPDAEIEAKLNQLSELLSKMKILLRAAGLSEKGINIATEMPFEYLEKFAELSEKSGRPISHPKNFEQLIVYERQTRILAKNDAKTITEYRFAKTNNLEKLIEFHYKNSPHLSKWFKKIDEGDTNDHSLEVYNESYKRLIDTWKN